MGKVMELWLAFSTKEKIFLLLAMACGFLISADYAIIRPASQSIFVHFFGSKMLPYVWICSIPFNLLIVSLYNYFLPKWGCFRFFLLSSILIATGNGVAGYFIGKVPAVSFSFYIWKEVYVLLMFQQVWAVIHATISLEKAKYLYGVLFGFGALGGFLGSLVPGFLAVWMGSESLLFFTAPLYLFLIVTYFGLIKYSGVKENVSSTGTKSFSSLAQGVRLITSSFVLKAILGMAVCMQITATLTDFQFQSLLEKGFPDKDLRTQCVGQLVSIGNVLTMGLQFFGTFLCIRLLGLQRSHFLVPAILGVCALIFLFSSSFTVMATFFVTLKALEFSLFTVIKEMLYIPLRLEEKFQAKAIIDVFMGRFAKIGASLVILGSQFLFPSYIGSLISWLSLGIFLLWCLLVASLKEKYPKYEKSSDETRA